MEEVKLYWWKSDEVAMQEGFTGDYPVFKTKEEAIASAEERGLKRPRELCSAVFTRTAILDANQDGNWVSNTVQ
ncbi:hypothetical protein PMI39_008915 [Pantoea sp. YR343]|uniref:hypothetical protein n=1 Tax=Pantoea sp. YR343 TaxID=1144341 RepID=UPI000270E82D|nr:hypothetical protein [Pantoea sp. YR343]KAJ9432442.1 hypothetical protein PMI39_008915 [Pantoea sp. YR343]